MVACYEKFQCSVPSVLAVRLRARTRNRASLTQSQQRRSLQGAGNPKASEAPVIDYLELPMALWTSKGSGDEFLKGNAIKLSPYNNDMLYATNRAGDLRILSASNGKLIDTVSPSPRSLTEDGITTVWSLYSASGMAFGRYSRELPDVVENDSEDNDDSQNYNDYLEFLLSNGIQQPEEETQSDFVVYSIVDEAPESSRFLPKTRVVCVSIPEHKILWVSAGLPGTPNGSPLVYYTDLATSSKSPHGSDNTSGVYVVLTHNSVLMRPDNSTRTTGHLTVLDPFNGHVKWTQSEWSRDEIPKGYGPPEISHSPIEGGGYSGGSFDNKNDVIMWTSSDQEGRGSVGNIYSFQMKSVSELNANNSSDDGQNDPFEIRVLKKVRWNSIARPAMNRNGTHLYVGVTGNAVRGWNGIAKFNETANWSTRLVAIDDGTETFSENVVVPTAPVLSADEERLFVVTVKNETICLDSRTGATMWKARSPNPSALLAEPRASPDNHRLYVILSEDGRVHAINQRNGLPLWSFGCDQRNLPAGNTCMTPPVFADFDLAADGTILYYGTSDGRIVALTLGHRLDDERISSPSSPTVTIELDRDDRGPIEFDRKTPFNIDVSGDEKKKNLVNLAGVVVGIILSLSVTLVSIVYVMKSKGIEWQNYRLPRHGSSQGGERKWNTFVGRFGREGGAKPDGPDVYEDRIIASLSDDGESKDEQFFTQWSDPTHSNPKYIVHDDESPPADRLSVLLGTSNRIAPIMDNFGFGQAVLI